MKNITLGTNTEINTPFVIPLAGAATKTIGVFGKKGAGKTYAAAVWVEQLLLNKVPVIVLDPVGRWWDLGVNADGKSPGFPIAVIGGRHGQIPLTPDMGAAISRYVAEKHVPTVVDLSDQSKNTWRRVVADFCDQLFAINDAPVHVILEEAPEFIPQRFFGDQAVVFGAVDRLVRLGRNRGIGITLIGQRLQTTNKDSLSQVDMLTVMRLIDPQGRKAAREWVVAKGEEERADAFVDALTSLKTGTGYIWSPEWLETFVPVAFNRRITYHFDAERTLSETGAAIQVAQAVDANELQRLFSKFQEKTIEPAAGTKGKVAPAITRQISDLKRENASLKSALEAAQAQAISDEEIETRIQRAVAQATDDMQARIAQYSGFVNQFIQMAQTITDANGTSAEPARVMTGVPAAVRAFVEKQTSFFGSRTVTNVLTVLGDNFARFPDGMTSEEIATEANYDPRGGRFQDTLRLLTKRRVIIRNGERYQLNPAHLK
jgi:hypothetical protein